MENNIKIRIQRLMELEQLNPASFAKAIQVNPSAISHILNERNKPSTDIIVKILNTFRSLNSDWLVLGIGSMYRNEKDLAIQEPAASLFDNVLDTQPIVHSEPTQSIINENTTTREANKSDQNTLNAEISSSQASKIVEKIIVYYSDNSFEEFNPSCK